MRKNILGICAAIAVVTVLFCEKYNVEETISPKTSEMSEGASEIGAEVASAGSEEEYEIVKAAEFPEEKDMILIEDEKVPLAAMPVEKEDAGRVAAEPQSDTPVTAQDVQKSQGAVSTQEIQNTQNAEKSGDAVGAQDTQNAEKSRDAVGAQSTQKGQNIQKQQDNQEKTDSKTENLGGGIYGYYDEQASAALLSQINKMRTGAAGVGALSGELNDIAEKRALSCIKDFSHNGMETAGECMAIGQADAAGVLTSWYASDDHRTYVSDPAYTQAGTACIRYDKGNGEIQTIWVLVLN